jgi:hypothetical protein
VFDDDESGHGCEPNERDDCEVALAGSRTAAEAESMESL